MLSVKEHVVEEKKTLKNMDQIDLTVKVVSYDTAKRLGDAICIKYKKAFDMLKDR